MLLLCVTNLFLSFFKKIHLHIETVSPLIEEQVFLKNKFLQN